MVVVLLWGVALYRRARIAWYVWLYFSATVIIDALMAEGGPDLATHHVLAASVEMALLVSPPARAWFAERTLALE